ncbi:MAG: chromate transporter [Alphaproteobacteria bacterium]|nr:chromate transporter [Alphaproteobacteria bacterium]
MRELFNLLMIFAKVGLFTFGGGYAMLPLLKAETVDRRGFLSEEELLNLYSIGQCTPGIIAINVATFIGYKQKGIWGAIFATIGMILPSIVIIILIASVLGLYMHNRYVSYAFAGIRVCVIALIADIVYDLWRKNIKTSVDLIIFVLAVLVLLFADISAVWVVIFAALTALFVEEIRRKRTK